MNAVTLAEMLALLFPAGSPKSLTPKQGAIVQHPQGPAWVMAGPGSGKTEVLTLFVLPALYMAAVAFLLVVLLLDPVQRKYSFFGLLIVALGVPVYYLWRPRLRA